MRRPLLLLSLLLLTGIALLAQLNRGTLTGSVTDHSGALVPGAKVSIRETGTNLDYRTATTSAGQYTMANLPPGTYEVACEAPGFKRSVRADVVLGAAATLRVDLQLEVGDTAESISVTADLPRIQTDSPRVATSLSGVALRDLPLSFGGGRNPVDFAFKIAPGVQGTAFQSVVNGGTRMSKEVLLDGESTSVLRMGDNPGVSVEALGEFKVETSGISAEYGRTQGGVFNFIMKSGTNELHGSAFGGLRNEALNANDFASNFRGAKRPRDRRTVRAGSIGGPVHLPKLYDGRNRTFFYVAYEKFRNQQLGFGAPTATAPVPEFYDGDFSRLLTNVRVGADALGRDVFRGAIYDPATFRQLPTGRWVGDMFPGNRIPASRFSQVSRRMNEIARKHYLPTVRDANGQVPLQNNMLYPIAALFDTSITMFSFKVDQSISTAHKLSASLSQSWNPSTRAEGGLWDITAYDGGPLAQSRQQDINVRQGRVSYDWTVGPRVLNYLSASINRMTEFTRTLNVATDGAAAIGLRGLSTEGFPSINWGGGPFVGLSNPGYSHYFNNGWTSWSLRDTVSVARARHFIKAGLDVRRNLLNYMSGGTNSLAFSALGTAIPNETFSGNQTGYAFASYLLGIVHSGSGPDTRLITGSRFHYYSLFVNDDFKVSSRLTLQLGLRWEYSPPMFEVAGRMATWSPAETDPQSGLPGAYQFVGSCTACTGKRYFGTKDWNNLAPRVGVAYRLKDRWTIRGSYGVFYDADLPGVTVLGTPWLYPWIGTYNLQADAVTPWRGIFNWDNGFPQDRFIPGEFNKSYGNINRPTMVDPQYNLSPYTQQWNLNVQHQLPARTTLEAGYLGNKGTKLRNRALVLPNQMQPGAMPQYGAGLTRAVTNPAEAAAAGVRYPYPGFRGTVASALRQYPQVVGNQTVLAHGSPEGMSTYHSMQLVLNKEFSSGLNAYVNYVWSKALTDTSSSATTRNDNPAILDVYNRRLDKSYATGDVPHAFKAFVSYELPVGRGKRYLSGAGRVANALLGGWSLSAILNYSSGTPLRFAASTPISVWNGGTNRPNVAAGALRQPFENSRFDLANASVAGSNQLLDRSKFADPSALTLGSGAVSYGSLRDFPVLNEDFALQKNARIHEKYRVQIRAEFLNAMNRSTLGGIQTNVTNRLFGQVASISGSRQAQIGARLDF